MDRWTRLCAVATSMVWAYVASVLLYDRSIAGLRMGFVAWLLSVVAIGLLGYVLLSRRRSANHFTEDRAKNYFLAAITTLLGLLFLDVSLFWMTERRPPSISPGFDPHTWIGEIYPRLYYPTEQNFRIHKPDVEVAAKHFGDLYTPRLLASPVMRDSILSLKRASIRINSEGFRAQASLTGARCVALGDSFAFGWGLGEGEGWVARLGTAVAGGVYNLGVHDASPWQELELLRYVIERYDPPLEQVLWMIYEGNDLEDSYAPRRPQLGAGSARRAGFQGTIVGHLTDIPKVIQRESLIDRLRRGKIRLGQSRGPARDALQLDGVSLSHPVYRSPVHGIRMFHAPTVERCQLAPDYVLDHPHLPLLDETLANMRQLSLDRGFDVVVVIAPSAVRLHADQFAGFPAISAPVLSQHVRQTCMRLGMTMIDLTELMRERADRELLYFRDDDHWNAAGHAVVADILAAELYAPGREPEPSR